ncbi:uncharacterized protein LOC144120093 [Amblyomma americanum]
MLMKRCLSPVSGIQVAGVEVEFEVLRLASLAASYKLPVHVPVEEMLVMLVLYLCTWTERATDWEFSRRKRASYHFYSCHQLPVLKDQLVTTGNVLQGTLSRAVFLEACWDTVVGVHLRHGGNSREAEAPAVQGHFGWKRATPATAPVSSRCTASHRDFLPYLSPFWGVNGGRYHLLRPGVSPALLPPIQVVPPTPTTPAFPPRALGPEAYTMQPATPSATPAQACRTQHRRRLLDPYNTAAAPNQPLQGTKAQLETLHCLLLHMPGPY